MQEIIIAGFGGQGVLTAGRILIEVAAKSGLEVTWTSSYGAEMRGGTASCSVILSEEEIGSPYPTKLNVLIALNEPSVHKFIGEVKEGGTVIVNSSLIGEIDFPENIKVYGVDATDIANNLNNPKGTNLIMLGAYVAHTDLFELDSFSQGISDYFGEAAMKRFPANLEGFNLGAEKASKLN